MLAHLENVNVKWSTLDFNFTKSKLVHLRGKLDISEYKANLDVGLNSSYIYAKVPPEDPDYTEVRYVNYFTPVGNKVGINVETATINIETHDAESGLIASLLPVIKPLIVPAATKGIELLMDNKIVDPPNEFLTKKYGFRRPFFSVAGLDQVEVDFSISDIFDIGEEYTVFPYRGICHWTGESRTTDNDRYEQNILPRRLENNTSDV